MFDEDKLKEVAEAAKTTDVGKKVMLYSRPALIILRYLSLKTPRFSCSGAAAELLKEAVKRDYPELWQRMEAEGVPDTTPLERPYWPKKFPRIEGESWEKATQETEDRMGRIVTVYHPRISAVLRYRAATEPRLDLSKVAARMLEGELEKRYPGAWERAEESAGGGKRLLTDEEAKA